MRKKLVSLFALVATLYIGWAFTLPILYLATHPIRDRKVDADVTMVGEFRDGRLSIRNYYWTISKDGYQREIGGVTYGFGTYISIEVAREYGGESKVINVFYDDGEMIFSKFYDEKETPLSGWIISEGQKSLEMGRKRLQEYRDKKEGK